MVPTERTRPAEAASRPARYDTAYVTAGVKALRICRKAIERVGTAQLPRYIASAPHAATGATSRARTRAVSGRVAGTAPSAIRRPLRRPEVAKPIVQRAKGYAKPLSTITVLFTTVMAPLATLHTARLAA